MIPPTTCWKKSDKSWRTATETPCPKLPPPWKRSVRQNQPRKQPAVRRRRVIPAGKSPRRLHPYRPSPPRPHPVPESCGPVSERFLATATTKTGWQVVVRVPNESRCGGLWVCGIWETHASWIQYYNRWVTFRSSAAISTQCPLWR